MVHYCFSRHAKMQMQERGASEAEIIETIETGEKIPAKRGRSAYRKNFQFNDRWGDKTYAIKQVMPVVASEEQKIVVITVYTFYF
ncbi:DUF4258 domain-containing protein [Candidatus Peregrinibacteria bacterium]|nr:DUF4258 domain-containing protein [Candidatus Peregrinibacteria bacterium]